MIDGAFPRAPGPPDRRASRPLEPADAPDVHTVWNDAGYLRFAPQGFLVAGADLDRAIEWCTTGVEERRRAGSGVSFAVVPREGSRLIGLVSLSETDWTAMTTEIH